MSGREVDERVVEMRFDNQHFEKNVHTTMSTLDKFKEKLNFRGASKGLEEVGAAANKCDMTGLSGAVQTVQLKFSAMEAVALTTLSRITNSAITTGENLIKSLSIDNIAVGWDKFGKKTTSVGTLIAQGYDMSLVTEQLERLNWFTDETSYNFTDMVENISKFTASGKDLKESVTAMEGIANWAALSGQNASVASRAMYQISQAMGAGIMRKEDYKSIQNASMDTEEFRQKALDAAVALGTLKKNADGTYRSIAEAAEKSENFSIGQFADHLTKDAWFTSDVMMKVFGDYSNAVDQIYEYAEEKGITASEAIEELGDKVDAFGLKAFKAAQEARTWSDVVDSVKDAVSTGWMNTFELLIGNYEQATKVWTELANTLYDVFAEGGNARNELLKAALSGENGWSGLVDKVSECGVKLEDFQNALVETGKKHGAITEQAIKDAGSFEASLESGWLTNNIIAETLREFANGVTAVSEASSDAATKLEALKEIADRVIMGDFGNGVDRIEALTKAGYDASLVQDLVNNKLLGTEVDLTKLSEAQMESLGLTENQVSALKDLAKQAEETGTPISELIANIGKPSGRELLIDSFRNALTGLIKVIDTVKEAWKEIFPPMTAERLYSIIEKIHEFSEKLVMTDETADKVKRTLKGVFAILDVIRTILGGGLKIALTIVKTVIESLGFSVADVTANVGDAMVAFRDWVKDHNLLSKAAEKIAPIITKIIEVIKAWIDKIKSSPELMKFFTRLADGAKQAGKWIQSFIGGALERFSAFLDRLKDVDSFSFENIGKRFSDLKERIVGCFTGANSIGDVLSNFWKLITGSDGTTDVGQAVTEKLEPAISTIENVKGSVESFSGTVKEKMEGAASTFWTVSDKIKGAFESIRDWLANLDWGAIFGVGIGVGTIAALVDLASVLRMFAGPVKALTTVLEGAAKIEKAIAFEKKAAGFKTIASGLLMIAIAVAVLAYSIKSLVGIPWDDMKTAVFVVGGLILVLGGLAIAMAVLSKDSSSTLAFSASLVAFAASIFLIVLALKELNNIMPGDGGDWTNIGTGLLIIAGMMGALILVSLAISKIKPVEAAIKSMSLMMLAIGLAMKMLVNALIDLQNIDADSVGESITNLLKILGMIGLAILASKNASFGTAVSIISMALALKMIVGVIRELGEMDSTQCLLGIQRVETIFGAFSVALLSARKAGKNAAKAGVAIFAMSASLILVALAMKLLLTIKPADLVRATAVVTSLFKMFAIVTASSKLAGENAIKAGVMILAMSVALMIIAGAIAVLVMIGKESSQNLLNAFVAIELLLGTFGLLVLASSKTSKSIGTIIALTVAVAAITACLAVLTLVDSDKLLMAAASLGGIIMALMFAILATSKSKNALASIRGLSIAVVAIGYVLKDLAELNPQGVLASAVGLGLVLLAIAGSLWILSNTKAINYGTLAVGLIGMELALLGIAGMFLLLKELDPDATLKIAASLSATLLTLTVCIGILGLVGQLGLPAIGIGIAGLDLLIADLLVVFAGIGALSDWMKTQGFDASAAIDSGIELISKVAEGLGAAISSFGVGLTSGLPKMGQDIQDFWTNIEPFLTGLGSIGPEVATGAGILVETILGITAGEFLDGLTSFLTGGKKDLSSFAENISKLGEGLASFSKSLGEDFDATPITEGSKALKNLAEASNAIPQTGWFTAVDYDGFKTGLPKLGEGLVGFSDALNAGGTFNSYTIKMAAEALDILADVSNKIDRDGGLFQTAKEWLFGKSGTASFGEALTAMGEGLSSFSSASSTINLDNCTEAITVLKQLVDLSKEIPNSGGLLGKIMGDNDADKFGGMLGELGLGLAHFSDAVAGDAVDQEAVENACNSLSLIVEVAKSIPNSGGWLGAIMGENDADEFGAKLQGFADGLVDFSSTVKGDAVDYDAVKVACDSLNLIVAISKSIPNSGGWLGAIVGDNDADVFGDKLGGLADGLVAFSSKAQGNISTETVQQACDNLKLIIASIQEIPNVNENFKVDDFKLFGEMLVSLGDGMQTFSYLTKNIEDVKEGANQFNEMMKLISGWDFSSLKSLQSVVTDLDFSGVKSFLDCFNDITAAKKAEEAGGYFMDSIAKGMKDKFDSIRTEVGNFIGVGATSLIGKAKSYYDGFKDAGKYLVDGFSSGVSLKTYAASEAARAMARAAKNAAKEELNEHSPSKEGFKIGDFFGVGFINGIKENVDKAYGTSKKMAESARLGLTSTLGRIAQVIESGIDTNPVIRPVVDLSDVSASSGLIGGMFGFRPTLAVATAGSISSGMLQFQNGSSDDKLVSAINELGNKLGQSTGDTYNINGVTYDDGSNVSDAVQELFRAARIERRR